MHTIIVPDLSTGPIWLLYMECESRETRCESEITRPTNTLDLEYLQCDGVFSQLVEKEA